jgi:thioredoxin-related protein
MASPKKDEDPEKKEGKKGSFESFNYYSTPSFVELQMVKDYMLYPSPNGAIADVEMTSKETQGKKGYVVFHSPGCTHCQKLFPTIMDLTSVKNLPMFVGMVDVEDKDSGNNLLADYFGVAGTPTIMFYDGVNHSYYNGDLSVKGLLEHAKKFGVPIGDLTFKGGAKKRKATIKKKTIKSKTTKRKVPAKKTKKSK